MISHASQHDHIRTCACWRSLGTSVELRVSQPAALARARTIVEHELDAIDRTCSRFREDSDITRVNESPGRFVTVDSVLIEAIKVALRAAELTGGDVDPTLGMALELAGYDRDWSLLEAPGRAPVSDDLRTTSAHRARHDHDSPAAPPARPRVRARRRPGWQAVELDTHRPAVRVPHGVKLDLGATAKAWAADRAASAVHRDTATGVLVSLGGDIAIAGSAPPAGWRVHVTEDHRASPDAPGQTITLRSGGLATSSKTVRRWRHQGQMRHHILDPRTGQPVLGRVRTASVAAINCTDANIAATAALVRGARAPDWLTELGLPALLVDDDGRFIRVGVWPRETA